MPEPKPEPKSILKKPGSKKPRKEVKWESDDDLKKEYELEKNDSRGSARAGNPPDEEEKVEFERYNLHESGKALIKSSKVDRAAKALLSQELARLNAAVQQAAANAENVDESKEVDEQLDALDRYVNRILPVKLELIERASAEVAAKRKIVTEAEKRFRASEVEEEKSVSEKEDLIADLVFKEASNHPEAEVEISSSQTEIRDEISDSDLPLAREELVRAQTALESYISEITTQAKVDQFLILNPQLNRLVESANEKLIRMQDQLSFLPDNKKIWNAHHNAVTLLLENAKKTHDHEPLKKYLLFLDSEILKYKIIDFRGLLKNRIKDVVGSIFKTETSRIKAIEEYNQKLDSISDGIYTEEIFNRLEHFYDFLKNQLDKNNALIDIKNSPDFIKNCQPLVDQARHYINMLVDREPDNQAKQAIRESHEQTLNGLTTVNQLKWFTDELKYSLLSPKEKAEKYITQLVNLELPEYKQNVSERYQKTLASLNTAEIPDFIETLKLLLVDKKTNMSEVKTTEPKKKTGWIGSLFQPKHPGAAPLEVKAKKPKLPESSKPPEPPKSRGRGPGRSGSE